MFLYGTEPFPIVGFHQECTNGDSTHERVIRYAWGQRTLQNGVTKRSIGSGRAWSDVHGWGYAYQFIFLRPQQNAVVGFRQEMSNPDSTKPWVTTETWGNINEGNGISKRMIGHNRAWSHVYGESYSRRWLYIKQ